MTANKDYNEECAFEAYVLALVLAPVCTFFLSGLFGNGALIVTIVAGVLGGPFWLTFGGIIGRYTYFHPMTWFAAPPAGAVAGMMLALIQIWFDGSAYRWSNFEGLAGLGATFATIWGLIALIIQIVAQIQMQNRLNQSSGKAK